VVLIAAGIVLPVVAIATTPNLIPDSQDLGAVQRLLGPLLLVALGGLLLPALVNDGYPERFSIGLLTASGSLGLLFPLSVPLILYAIVAQNVAIENLFIGGLLPAVRAARLPVATALRAV